MPNRKIRPTDVNLGQTKRIIKTISVINHNFELIKYSRKNQFIFVTIKTSETEDCFYCGTTTGDVMQITYPQGQFKSLGPEKSKFSLGVTALQCLKNGDILAGAGDGKLMLLAPGTFKPKK